MKSVGQIQRQGKGKDVRKDVKASAAASGLPTEEIDSTVALIQALIPLGLQAVGDALDAEVTALAGTRYCRTGGRPGVVRWGQQPGSVYLADQKLPVPVPRVRDRVADHVRTAASPTGSGCRLVPEGAGGPELSAVRSLCGGGAGCLGAECLQRLPPLHPGQRPPPADPL